MNTRRTDTVSKIPGRRQFSADDNGRLVAGLEDEVEVLPEAGVIVYCKAYELSAALYAC